MMLNGEAEQASRVPYDVWHELMRDSLRKTFTTDYTPIGMAMPGLYRDFVLCSAGMHLRFILTCLEL